MVRVRLAKRHRLRGGSPRRWQLAQDALAVRDAGRHANLAVLLKEMAAERGLAEKYAGLAGQGSAEQLLAALAELTPR